MAGRLKEALDFVGAERESSLESGKPRGFGSPCLASPRSPGVPRQQTVGKRAAV